jgi:hypothetical protein
MAMLLFITAPVKGNKLTAELRDGKKLVFADTFDPMHAKAVAKFVDAVLARGYRLSGEQVLELRHGGELELAPAGAAAASGSHEPRGPRIVRRRRHEPAAAGTVYASLTAALADGADGDEFQWDDIEQLAVLDVDYHALPLDRRPEPFQLEALALTVRPRPEMFWPSKGRGLHLVFRPVGGLTAEEAAACGGLHVKQLDPRCTFEVIARTSYPPGREVWA